MQLKPSYLLSLCAAAAFSFTSCSDDDNSPVTPPDESFKPTTGIMVEGYYKGDIYDNGTGNLWINFMSRDLQWDDFEEDYTGTGDIVCIDFNTTLADNPDFAKLADGEYTAADTHAEFTINVDDGDSFVVKYINSVSTEYTVTGGSVSVSTSGEYTVIDAMLTLDDNTVYELSYVGRISFINRTGEGNMSNLTGDVTVSDLTQGVAMYFGETFTETSDLYMVVLAGDDYDLYENYGNAPSVWLGLNVTPGSSDGIPSGTYTLINAMEADDYDVWTALSGVYEASLGGFFGTWYFHTLATHEAAMQTGTVDVVNNGDDTYRISFELKDGYGNSVKGSYNGELSVEDLS